MKIHTFIFISILLIAVGTRLFAISLYPSGLNADEAALGYNAYSLLLTGKDEHGHPWPVNLESFGDFKPALYSYFLIPFIKIFGLTEFAVRLPSALAGIIGVVFIYLLAKELLVNPEIAALLLAISPWHIHFSRGAWEVNLATTFILVGTWGFLRWQRTKNIRLLLLFAVTFILSLYTYQSARLIAPLLGLGLSALYFKELVKYPRQLIICFVLSALLLIPLAYSLATTDVSSRLSGVGITADEGPLNRINELRGQHPANSFISKILHNRRTIYVQKYIQNYISHFDGDFLFVNGDQIMRNKVPETGLLYTTDFILLALGIFYLIRHPAPNSKIIWLWLLIAPAASALTFQVPHALRAQNMVIPLILLCSLGVSSVFRYLKHFPKVVSLICFLILLLGYTWQFSRYLHQYYIHYPQTYPVAWEYGFKQLVAYIAPRMNQYDRILVTDKYDQPYILFLFYSQYPPGEFQNHHVLTFRDKFNFSTVRDYGKFHFAATPWDQVRDIHSSLIVAAPEDIPPIGVNIVNTINFPNGDPAFKIVSN